MMKKQRSLQGKKWLYEFLEADFRETLEIQRRGAVDLAVWQNPQLPDLPDPLGLYGLKTARDRIFQAIKAQERIMVYGDFDCDGITSTASLVQALKRLGALVSYRIPDRVLHSHGLKTNLIDEIISTGATLLITVDCGVNDRNEVDYAQKHGLEVIITDHHQADPERIASNALAVVNPNQESCAYASKNLAGVGVVFKLLQSLNNDEDWLQPYLALAAIGTVADCVPVTGESRQLVQLGLKALKQNLWPGLQDYLKTAETIDEEYIGFQLAPRLNAASRLGDVTHAVQLFLGEASGHDARQVYLEDLNQQRRALSTDFTRLAQTLIEPEKAVQVLVLDECPVGVLGLVASRLVEQLHQPIICLTQQENEEFHASARAPQGGALATALEHCAAHLMCFGGHDGAAGFRIKKPYLTDFSKNIEAYYSAQPRLTPSLNITAVVPAEKLGLDWLAWQKTLSPFGVGNSKPVWQVSNLLLTGLKPLGKEGVHARLLFEGSYEAVLFNAEALIAALEVGVVYDVALQLSQNTWNGETKIQWQVVDMKLIQN